jgi:hypothetical protein
MTSSIKFRVARSFPTLWIVRIKISIGSFCDCGTAPTEREQLAFGTFGKLRIFTVVFHAFQPHICDAVTKDIADFALRHSSAGINIAGRKNGDMTVPAVAAAVYHPFFPVFRKFKCPRFILI